MLIVWINFVESLLGGGGGETYWTAEQVRIAAQIPESYAENVEQNWPLLYRAMVKYNIATPRSMVAMIGTIAHESASTFAPVEESYWLSASAKAAYYQSHGYGQYWGRGFIQTTWETNYSQVAQVTGLDTVNDPELLLQAGPAAEAACVYWLYHPYGPPFNLAQAGDWAEVRKSVYGAKDSVGEARIRFAAQYLGVE